jgi:hypothetical protein
MSWPGKLEKAHIALTKQLDGEFLLISFETQGEGFRVWVGEGDELTAMKAEAAVRAFLERMVDVESRRDDSCAACPSCETRLARVKAALAALGDLPGWTPGSSPQPMETLQ